MEKCRSTWHLQSMHDRWHHVGNGPDRRCTNNIANVDQFRLQFYARATFPLPRWPNSSRCLAAARNWKCENRPASHTTNPRDAVRWFRIAPNRIRALVSGQCDAWHNHCSRHRYEWSRTRSRLSCIRMHKAYSTRHVATNYFVLPENRREREWIIWARTWWGWHWPNGHRHLHPCVRSSLPKDTQLTTETHWPVRVDHMRIWSSRYNPYK